MFPPLLVLLGVGAAVTIAAKALSSKSDDDSFGGYSSNEKEVRRNAERELKRKELNELIDRCSQVGQELNEMYVKLATQALEPVLRLSKDGSSISGSSRHSAHAGSDTLQDLNYDDEVQAGLLKIICESFTKPEEINNLCKQNRVGMKLTDEALAQLREFQECHAFKAMISETREMLIAIQALLIACMQFAQADPDGNEDDIAQVLAAIENIKRFCGDIDLGDVDNNA